MTSSLPRKCSTPELRGHLIQTGNPTTRATPIRVERETGLEPATLSLEGWRSSQLSYSRIALKKWGGKDSNLRRLSRQIYSLFPLTTREPPRTKWRIVEKNSSATRRQYPKNSHPQEAQHPLRTSFQHASLGGAGKGTRTPDLLITNQLLYQLSYASPANEKRSWYKAPPRSVNHKSLNLLKF